MAYRAPAGAYDDAYKPVYYYIGSTVRGVQKMGYIQVQLRIRLNPALSPAAAGEICNLAPSSKINLTSSAEPRSSLKNIEQS